MIDVSYLYSGTQSVSVPHRYGVATSSSGGSDERPYEVPPSASQRRPIVVWNITRMCNLKCLHCYSDSERKHYEGELTKEEAKTVIDDLASFQVPAVLFSGGEPLLRPDLMELAEYARDAGLRTTLSTNGTFINEKVALQIKQAGFSYVGVSLDGVNSIHDHFRGVEGAFRKTLAGIRHLIAIGQKTGLRLTLTDYTINQIDLLFDLIEREGIHRVCFYHLVPSGRGKEIFDINPEKTRRGIDRILKRTELILKSGYPLEVLTVDNHADGPYIYLKLREYGDERAEKVYERLCWNGGGLYSSGIGIACIDSKGDVHPDQFWTETSLGNVREKRFSEIWTDPRDPLLRKLRDRKNYIYGRCRACRFFDACGGALRIRSKMVTGDSWGPDPACYLTNQEVGVFGE
ncbi:MAG: radical SAM protein [Candidatus Omnitrophica bacterium]|nr:radical SAM protein [Candidatus Omnitrophota bacterium]